MRGAGLVLQTVWGYKDLRRTLEKDGWKKTDFMVNLSAANGPSTRANGTYEDGTMPLLDKGRCARNKFLLKTAGQRFKAVIGKFRLV